jgi:hypothetical protein
MTRSIATAALIALLLGAALPQAALAAHTDGIWKIDPTKSSFSASSATHSMERVADAAPGAGGFIVVSNGNVYLVTGATAYESRGLQQTDYAHMATQGKAVLIGRNARSRDVCGFRCQGGLPEPKISLSFRPVSGADQHLNDMLAQRD